MKKLYSHLGAILGFAIILLYGLERAAVLFDVTFEGMEDILGYFDLVKEYLVYALAGLAGLELVSGKSIIAFAFYIILAFVVISTFFPDVINGYIG